MLNSFSDALLLWTVRIGVPSPGDPQAPPGFERFADIMGWVKWLALGVLIISLMAAGAKMGFGSRHGDGEEHAGRIGRVLLGVIVVSAAGALVGFLA